MASTSVPASRVALSAASMSRAFVAYSVGLARSLPTGKCCVTRPTPSATTPASSPQHSLGSSARAWASTASSSGRGISRRVNGIMGLGEPGA